jgi:hypothetical protein
VVGSGGLDCDTVGQAHCAVLAVVVAGAEQTRATVDDSVDHECVGQPELGEVEGRVVVRGPGQAHQVVGDLGEANRGLASSVPGRPSQSPEQAAARVTARAEIERLRATVAEQAVALHLHEGRARWD